MSLLIMKEGEGASEGRGEKEGGRLGRVEIDIDINRLLPISLTLKINVIFLLQVI